MSSILQNPSNTKIISEDKERIPEILNICRNPEIMLRYLLQQAVDLTQKDIKNTYDECLSYTDFAGGWNEKPKYALADYESYISLMRKGGQLDEKNLTKYALIGANKLWDTLDSLNAKVLNNLGDLAKNKFGEDSDIAFINFHPIETAELNCPDGLCARTTPIRNTCYDDKNLLVLDPEHILNIKIRAVSTYSFEFEESKKEDMARRLLDSYKRFHSAITENKAKLAVTYSKESE